MNNSYLDNKLISLRAPEPSDLEFLYQWENDTSLWCYSDTLAPLSKHLITDWIVNYNPNPIETHQLRFMITAKESGITIGTIDFYDIDFLNSRCAVGILIATDFQRNGYAISALSCGINYIITKLGIHQIYAYIPDGNIPSEQLFSAAGFKYSGTLRDWHRIGNSFRDIHLWQLITC